MWQSVVYMYKKIYFSPVGYLISFVQNVFGSLFKPFMVYGYWNRPTRNFRRFTRVSSTAALIERKKIDIAENCWIWHNSIIDGSNGVKIGEGVQIGAWVGIFTHSSHVAIRLLGKKYMEFDKSDRIGYLRASVEIGDYTFIASGVSIMPGVKIGKGCIITAGSVVTKNIPNYSIASGNPAKCIGSTLELDRRYYMNPIVKNNYFDVEAMENFLINKSLMAEKNNAD